MVPITVRGLRKRYGKIERPNGIDFDVAHGEVFGFLGPNGAGKTTTIEILEGLRERTAGEVSVLGFDPGTDAARLKDRIGVCLQSTRLSAYFKVHEVVDLCGTCYSRTQDPQALMKRFDLWSVRDAMCDTLSGGQRQRVALTLALLNDPQVLFLDEPSAGLDPQARQEMHAAIQQLRIEGRTIVLTTHNIDEAAKLCDRVAIIHHGLLVALGRPAELQSQSKALSSVAVTFERPIGSADVPVLATAMSAVLSFDGFGLRLESQDSSRTVAELVRWSDQNRTALRDIQVTRPSLEDVFLELTQ